MCTYRGLAAALFLFGATAGVSAAPAWLGPLEKEAAPKLDLAEWRTPPSADNRAETNPEINRGSAELARYGRHRHHRRWHRHRRYHHRHHRHHRGLLFFRF